MLELCVVDKAAQEGAMGAVVQRLQQRLQQRSAVQAMPAVSCCMSWALRPLAYPIHRSRMMYAGVGVGVGIGGSQGTGGGGALVASDLAVNRFDNLQLEETTPYRHRHQGRPEMGSLRLL